MSKLEDYIGQTFNHLTITGVDRERMNDEKLIKGHYVNSYVFADCDCGVCHRSYNINKIKRGETKSCGHLCLQHGRQYKHNNFKFMEEYGIIFTQDETAFYFDLEDYKYLENKFWYNSNGYLVHCYIDENGKNIYERFHRLIMSASEDQIVDHINRNTTDNRKINLRICTHQENDMNRNLFSTNTSGVMGVFYNTNKNKWDARIKYCQRTINLGRFKKFKNAVRARLKGELLYFKDFSPQLHLLKDYFTSEEIEELKKQYEFLVA